MSDEIPPQHPQKQDVIGVMFVGLLYLIPIITVGVIGWTLTRFFFAELHYTKWISHILGFGLSLLFTYIFVFVLNQEKTLFEIAVSSFILLILFLVLSVVVAGARDRREKNEKQAEMAKVQFMDVGWTFSFVL